jgi:SNF2 family DNA or RNA helicase
VAIEWLKELPTAFLGDDMGLGKTLSVLSFFATLQRTEGYERLLVVCPNSLTRNWVREATTWFPHMKATVLAGDKTEKAWTLRLLAEGSVPCDVFVANYEGVRLDYVTPELAEIASKRKTLLCIDESQRVKNPQAKTFKALSTIAPHCKRRVLLSGTPTPKDVSDLWAQMKLLDGGKRFGRSFYKWLGTVAELGTEYSEFAIKKFNEYEVAEAIYRAQEVMLRRRKEKVIDLPAKTFSLREIELTGSQRERYDEIREGLILRMRSTSGEQFVREITNILEEYLRAVQVASNPRLIDPEWKGEPAKFLELDEIVNEVVREQGQKVVIWTNYLGNIRELVERYKDLGAAPFSGEVSAADREMTVRAFQTEEKPRVLVAVPAAGGVGITLTAAQTAVYIDKTWNAEHWMQSVDRIHRIGQRGTVNVISLLSCKVDEMIHWNLRRKEQGQADVLGDNGPTDPSLRAVPTRKELLEALEEDL